MNDVLLRDLFAAAAMAGELASQDECTGMYGAPFERLAYKAYNIADAMMAERKKRMETSKPCLDEAGEEIWCEGDRRD